MVVEKATLRREALAARRKSDDRLEQVRERHGAEIAEIAARLASVKAALEASRKGTKR